MDEGANSRTAGGNAACFSAACVDAVGDASWLVFLSSRLWSLQLFCLLLLLFTAFVAASDDKDEWLLRDRRSCAPLELFSVAKESSLGGQYGVGGLLLLLGITVDGKGERTLPEQRRSDQPDFSSVFEKA